MTHKLLSALSLSGLLLACAHDRSKENVTEPDQAQAEARAENDAREEERGERGERGDRLRAERGERGEGDVDLPRRRGERGRMASAGGELPEDKRATDAADETATEEHSADNTGINERDRGGKNLTPMDQGNSEIDLDLTQRIRKAIMKADNLSFSARNVKVITREGQVVLRGPVKSQEEKDTIFKAAVTEAGVGHVTNQLEVDQD